MTVRPGRVLTTPLVARPRGAQRFLTAVRLRGRTERPKLRYEHINLAGLPDDEFAERFALMGDVIRDATIDSGDNEWATADWEARRARTRRGTNAYMVWDGSVLAGFLLYSTFPFAGRICVHMKTGYVRSAYQSGGIGFSLSVRMAYRAFLRRPTGEFLLLSDMLNPIVVSGWVARFPSATKMLPGEFGQPSAELAELGVKAAAQLYPWADYEPEHCVLRGKTMPRSDVIELSGNQVVDDYFTANLDPTNGDTILYLAEFDHPTVLRGLVELVRFTARGLDRRLGMPHHGRRSAAGSAAARAS